MDHVVGSVWTRSLLAIAGGGLRAAAVAAVCGLAGCAAAVHKVPGAEGAVQVPEEASHRIVLLVTGSKDLQKSSDWEQFKGEWRSAFREETERRSLAYSSVDDEAAGLGGAPGTFVRVDVGDYRYISPGARYGFGVMTGNAYVEATVSFSDIASGRRFGRTSVNTSSTAWQGIFSAMTEKQVQAIAKDVVDDVQRR